MRSVRDIEVLENIPIVVRAALNVPLEHGAVSNAYRLERALPTLRYLRSGGARIVLISHLGEAGTETLAPVAEKLASLLPGVTFFPESTGASARQAVRALAPGKILVLENLRRHKGETANDAQFAHELATLGDIFVQDSFDTCHRMHASIVGVPKLLPSYAGLLLEEEVTELSKALVPAGTSLAVIGGAKFATKEPVLAALLKSYDHLFVGGALANDFLKAAGHGVGKSLVSGANSPHITRMLSNPKMVLPLDVLVVHAHAGTPNPLQARVAKVSDVQPDEIIVDVGPATSAHVADLAAKAKRTLWNGPLGNYENGFGAATDSLARAIAASSAHSVVGGGDTIASIETLGIFSKFSFVSTGGGAMLDFLAHRTLPGIDVLGR
ncbi:MAG: phosphoglycerate kinase [Candidatus Paceibacterota bacterium]